MSWMDPRKSDQGRSAVGSGSSGGRGSVIAISAKLAAGFKIGSMYQHIDDLSRGICKTVVGRKVER